MEIVIILICEQEMEIRIFVTYFLKSANIFIFPNLFCIMYKILKHEHFLKFENKYDMNNFYYVEHFTKTWTISKNENGFRNSQHAPGGAIVQPRPKHFFLIICLSFLFHWLFFLLFELYYSFWNQLQKIEILFEIPK